MFERLAPGWGCLALPDLVPFGALGGLVPGPLIADVFFFPGIWFPGWLPSGLDEGLLQEFPSPFGLGW